MICNWVAVLLSSEILAIHDICVYMLVEISLQFI